MAGRRHRRPREAAHAKLGRCNLTGVAPKRAPLLLRRWQEQIVYDRYPELLLRGLIHSDGCRCVNRIRKHTKAGLKRYEYPRYMFRNASGHIRGIFIEACRRVRVDWRWDGPTQISIARRQSVALLDSFVGPKT